MFFKSTTPRSHTRTPWQRRRRLLSTHTPSPQTTTGVFDKSGLDNWSGERCWKATSALDNYQTGVLAPLSITCMELLVPQCINARIPPDFDWHQLVNTSKWSTRSRTNRSHPSTLPSAVMSWCRARWLPHSGPADWSNILMINVKT